MGTLGDTLNEPREGRLEGSTASRSVKVRSGKCAEAWMTP